MLLFANKYTKPHLLVIALNIRANLPTNAENVEMFPENITSF